MLITALPTYYSQSMIHHISIHIKLMLRLMLVHRIERAE